MMKKYRDSKAYIFLIISSLGFGNGIAAMQLPTPARPTRYERADTECAIAASNITRLSEFLPLASKEEKESLCRFAALCAKPAILQVMTDQGVDIAAKNWRGENALHRISSSGAKDAAIQGCVAFLIKHGADKDAKDFIKGRAPLHEAVIAGNKVLVQALLAAGCKAEPIDRQGQTPLIIATIYRKYDLIPSLVSAGADPLRIVAIPNFFGEIHACTAYKVACELAKKGHYLALDTFLKLGVHDRDDEGFKMDRGVDLAKMPEAMLNDDDAAIIEKRLKALATK